MSKISILTATPYGGSRGSEKYSLMIEKLNNENKLCKLYGVGFPRSYKIKNEPIDKMILTKICTRIAYLVSKISNFIPVPKYYSYWVKMRLLDNFFAKKIAKDESGIIFTNPLFYKTVKSCKNAGKYIVVEAGNSEPEREYQRIKKEYDKYGIKHQYIYGNPKYKTAVIKSLEMADTIVAISRLSLKTYIDGGYNEKKFTLIPLTGSNFLINKVEKPKKQFAFISTAFHSFIKGTHILLNAWKMAEIKDMPLIIIGSICEDMKEFIEKYGPFENVIYMGKQNNLPEIYSNYNAVGILMSLSEGAGRVTPEMMSYGFPMIVSSDATCDVVKDGVNGFIVDSEEELINRLKWFNEDKSRFLSMTKSVADSLNNRTVRDYSEELGNYLIELADRNLAD